MPNQTMLVSSSGCHRLGLHPRRHTAMPETLHKIIAIIDETTRTIAGQ